MKYEKTGKKARCGKPGNDEKEQVRKDDKEKKERKMNKRLQTLVKRNSIFNNVKCVSWLIH